MDYSAFLTLNLTTTFFCIAIKLLAQTMNVLFCFQESLFLFGFAFFFCISYNAFCFFFSGAYLCFSCSLTSNVSRTGTDDYCNYYRYNYFDNDNTHPLFIFLL